MENFFKKLFNSETKPTEPKPIRHKVKDVKPGEIIQIEWDGIEGKIGRVRCINNDTITKKILIEITWDNFKEMKCKEKEKIILDYDSSKLENFNLLNPIKSPNDVPSNDDFDVATLQKKINEHLEKEEYEKADELQKKIDKLLKK